MEKIQLPNGQTLSIPDNISLEDRALLRQQIKARFGHDIDETSILGQAVEIPKGFIRGAANIATDVPLGVASLFDVNNDGAIVGGLRSLKKYIREDSPVGVTPGYEGTFTTKLAEGFGSFVPFLGAGIAGRALAARGAISPTAGAFGLPAALAMPTGISAAADRVEMARRLGEDVSPFAETTGELLGSVIGLSEIAPIASILRRIPKNAYYRNNDIQERLKSAAQSALIEGGQESLASLSQDLVARGLYSDELPIGESILDEFTIGGIVGGTVDFALNSFAGKRGIESQRFLEKEQALRKNRDAIGESFKLKKAIEQGEIEDIGVRPDIPPPDIAVPFGPATIIQPKIEVIQNADASFSLLDVTDPANPQDTTFANEADALVEKDKLVNGYRVQQLKSTIENQLYTQGLINSPSAFEIGLVALDPNASEISAKSILNFDSKAPELDPNKIDEGIESYFKNKGVNVKPSYSMEEARKILNRKDFNQLQKDLASVVFKESEANGNPSIRDDKGNVNTTKKYIEEFAASKNIELVFSDPAVQFFSKRLTGYDNITKTSNKAAKELFLARLHSLPAFNSKQKFPDYRPRLYSAEDMANFVSSIQDSNFTFEDILSAGPVGVQNNKPAAEQFLRDLLVSGRANKLEGNKYAINRDFEFLIARRAEGFKETPQEFGDRLRKDGKLTETTIQALVDKEAKRQEKFLPPSETIPKMINIEQSFDEGRKNKFAREAKKMLDAAGLRDTGVVISNDLLASDSLVQQADGSIVMDSREVADMPSAYDKDSDIIFISLNQVNPDGTASDIEIQQRVNKLIDGELVKALRAKDLFAESEYNFLRNYVKKTKVLESFDNRFTGQNYYDRSVQTQSRKAEAMRSRGLPESTVEEMFTEDAIASLYKSRYANKNVPPKTNRLLDKIANFYDSLGKAIPRSGYKKASEVFNDIEQGRIGSRARGEIRTLRELDKNQQFVDKTPVEIEDELNRNPIKETAEEGNIATFIPVTPRDTGFYADLNPTPVTGIDLIAGRPSTGANQIYNRRIISQEQFDADRNVLMEFLSDKDAVGVAEWLSKNAPGKDYREISGRIKAQLEKFKKLGFEFEFTIYNSSGDARPGSDRKYLGNKRRKILGVAMLPTSEYGNIFRVYINDFMHSDRSKGSGVDYETILHELLHITTMSSIYAVERGQIENKKLIEANQKLTELRKFLRKEQQKRGEQDFYVNYGLQNNHELISVGLTDRTFQKFMEETVMPSKTKKKKSVWDNFVDALRNILGLPKGQETAFSEFLKQTAILTELNPQQIAQTGRFADIRTRGDLFSGILSSPIEQGPLETLSRIKNKAERQGIDLSISEDMLNISLSRIVVPQQNQGVGSQIMRDITTYADSSGKTITLTPSTDFGATSVSRLKNFYKQFGFVENKGRNKDFAFRDTMYRLPEQVNEDVLQKEIDDANSELYRANSILNADGPYVGKRTYNKLLSDVYVAQAKLDKLIAKRDALFNKIDSPNSTFDLGKRYFEVSSGTEKKSLQDAVESTEEQVKTTPNGQIPTYNINASDVAIRAARTFNEDTNAAEPEIKVDQSFYDSVDADPTIPDNLKDGIKVTGYVPPNKSWGERMIDFTQDPIGNISNFFKDFRRQLIDRYDTVQQGVTKRIEENEEVRLLNNLADTSTMAAIRMAERARGIFQGMLTTGYVDSFIEGQDALTHTKPLEIEAQHNPYLKAESADVRDSSGQIIKERGKTYGGLMQIIAPLYADTSVNREAIFGHYAKLKRIKQLKADGREVDLPMTPKMEEDIRFIEQNHKSVVEVYNNYQKWNGALIDFAKNKGLLSAEMAQQWKDHSSYYPFYRDMVDDTIQGPRIAAGSLPNNPLSIELKGSEDLINVNPIEAITRNSLSILTASMKNDGISKLMRDLQLNGEAEILDTPDKIKQYKGDARLGFAFVNGNKQLYLLKDPELFHSLEGLGGIGTDFVTSAVAVPASFLRDTVTRDPGFVIVNIMRDTLSSAVTSGANFTPVIDSFKNMFGDMKELEKFGVLGGYDFQNDEGSVKDFINRTMRREGMLPNNSISAQNAFFRLWDGLGALTTKSDGATRKAVYDSVYKDLKDRGLSEAQAQSEASFQALEIINFGRRGASPIFRVITSAIPFLNARIQGLDVLYRSFSGQYSATDRLESGETKDELKNRIIRRAFTRGGMLMGLTAIYYLLVSDTDEYKGLRREVRDDNWVIPLPADLPAVKIPIPFEIGMLFKALPERIIDETVGRQVEGDPLKSIGRQLGTATAIPFFQPAFGLQVFKPIAEVIANRNSFTNTEIVPYYQQTLEAELQTRPTTNEFVKRIAQVFGVSPIKAEFVLRGYGGTLGGYVLDVADAITRGVTGEPLIPPNINSVPVLKRLFVDLDRSGGLQQQFYELRNEVNTVVQSMNLLRKQKRFDEYSAYRQNMKGVLSIKQQVRAMEKYLDNYRRKRDRILSRTDISPLQKANMLETLEIERDKRLAFVPELRKQANIPIFRI